MEPAMSDAPSQTPTDVAAVPAPARPSVLGIILDAVMSGTGRRLLVFLLGFATVALNKRFGLDLDPQAIVAELALILGYIVQSAAKEAVVAHADARVAAAGASAAAAPGPVLNS